MTTAIDTSRIPQLTAEDLEIMDDAMLRDELAYWTPRRVEMLRMAGLYNLANEVEDDVRAMHDELRSRAPRTYAALNIYRHEVPHLNQRTQDAFALGLHLLSLPKKSVALDDVLRALGSEG